MQAIPSAREEHTENCNWNEKKEKETKMHRVENYVLSNDAH